MDRIEEVLKASEDNPSLEVVFGDEFTFYKQPEVSYAFALRGTKQPYAYRSCQNNTKRRIAATLNSKTGRVNFLSRSKVGVKQLKQFITQLDTDYSDSQRIYLVWDNWPVHKHPEVLEHLSCYPRIEVLWLPTYAPWTNPIEKLWLKLKADLLWMHRYSHRWKELIQQVENYLQQFANGSMELLHAVGLS
jgi:transposase